jgi:hypothetical protein
VLVSPPASHSSRSSILNQLGNIHGASRMPRNVWLLPCNVQYDGAGVLNPEAKQALSQRLAGLDE